MKLGSRRERGALGKDDAVVILYPHEVVDALKRGELMLRKDVLLIVASLDRDIVVRLGATAFWLFKEFHDAADSLDLPGLVGDLRRGIESGNPGKEAGAVMAYFAINALRFGGMTWIYDVHMLPDGRAVYAHYATTIRNIDALDDSERLFRTLVLPRIAGAGRGVMAEAREKAEARLKSLGIRYRYITCDGCPLKSRCPYAYDPYNIDGDCLAEK